MELTPDPAESMAPPRSIADWLQQHTDVQLTDWQHVSLLLVTVARLREHHLADGAHLILPGDVMPGATEVYGLPVVRANVPAPMVGVPAQEP